MKKRGFAVFLALAMCLALAVPAFGAEDDFDIAGDGVLWFYTGSGGDVVVPYGVKVINKQVFDECTAMTSVSIPDTVYQIGTDAFHGCTGLTSVSIPNSVAKILTNAFGGCTNLASVSIPDSVTSLGIGAFASTGLTSVYIPGSVGTIRGRTFLRCENLTDVVIGEGMTTVSTLDSDGAGAFQYCTSLVNVTIPNTVTTIGANAFYGCSGLTGLTVPDSVTSISSFAFMSCPNLTLYGSAGSYAEIFAKNNKIPFVVGTAPHIETGNNPNVQPKPSQDPQPEKPAALPTVEDIPAAGMAQASTQGVKLDGKDTTFQCYALKDEKGNLTNYVKLRDLALALNGTKAQFNVGWDGKISIASGTAYEVKGGEGTTPYAGSQPYTAASGDPVRFNGSPVNLTSFQLKDSAGNGYTYYKLRDLGQLLNFNVKWDDSAKSVVIESGKPFTGK